MKEHELKMKPKRPCEVTTQEIVKRIHGSVMEDRRIKIREIADTVGISTQRVAQYFTRRTTNEKI